MKELKMIKKIILTILCFLFLFSCGKKDDPEYKAKNITVLFVKI